MKRVVVWSFLLGMAMVLAGRPVCAADHIAGPLKAQWEGIRKNVVGTVEAVPEDKYDFKVQKDQRTFAETILHIANDDFLAITAVKGSQAGPDFHGPAA